MDDHHQHHHCGTNETNKSYNKNIAKYSNLCGRHFCFAATKRGGGRRRRRGTRTATAQANAFLLLPSSHWNELENPGHNTTTAERTIGSTHALPASRNLSLYVARCYFAGSPTHTPLFPPSPPVRPTAPPQQRPTLRFSLSQLSVFFFLGSVLWCSQNDNHP